MIKKVCDVCGVKMPTNEDLIIAQHNAAAVMKYGSFDYQSGVLSLEHWDLCEKHSGAVLQYLKEVKE